MEGIEGVRELVDSDQDLQPELLRVLNVPNQVLAPLPENLQVLLGVRLVQRLSWGDLRSPAMHLQRAGGGNDNNSVRGETADSTLDIAELLHTHVRPEASFCEDVPTTRRIFALLGPCELQGNTVGEDGRVAMSYVGEGTSMNKDRSTLRKHPLEGASGIG